MHRKMSAISFALPAAERKRTRLNVPAVATPTPMLPFTIMITTQDRAGRVSRVVRKLKDRRLFRDAVNATAPPMSSATPTQSRNLSMEMTLTKLESNTPLKRFSSIHAPSCRRLPGHPLPVGRAVFGK